MKQTLLTFKSGLLTKLLLSFTLLLTGLGNIWAQKTLPYEYGFEDNNLATDGWTQIDKITSSMIVKSGSYGVPDAIVTDTYCFRFSSAYNATEYLVSPLLSSSTTGIDVSFYYMNTSTNAKEKFQIGYSTSTGEGEPQKSSFIWLEEVITPAASMSEKVHYTTSINNSEIKYVAIKHISGNSHTFFIDDITIDASDTYKKPRNLAVDSYTSNSATLSWTAGDSFVGEEWEIAYSTKENFDPDTEGVKVAVKDNPYTLSGLTETVTYYAYVRSNYSGNYSAWCNTKLEFTPYKDLTINDGSVTSYYIPVYGYKANYDFKSQVIIPKSSLEDMVGREIIQLTLYASQASLNWGAARFDVYLNEVENTTYASTPVFESWGTQVCENANISISGNKMVIVLDTPYLYNGGNLMLGLDLATTGTAATSSWYGVSGTNNAAYYYWNGSKYVTTRTGFLPKVTFKALPTTVPVTIGANGYTTFACPRPLDLTTANKPEGLTVYRAIVDAENGKVRFTSDGVNQTVQANTGVLLGGTANTTYYIPVATSGTALGSNDLLVNSTGGTFDAVSGYTYFAMKKSSDPLVFATFDPSTVAIPTGKAYLKVLTDDLPAETRQLVFSFGDDEETGINSIENGKLKIENEAIYNLAGQRVEKPVRGLYIVSGKKMVVK